MLGLRQADRGTTGFPFAALPEEFDALEALENGAFAADGGACFEAVVLGHRGMWFEISRGGARRLWVEPAGGNTKMPLAGKSRI